MVQFSFIIPVYNRPQEIKELLESFKQVRTSKSFEIVIVEDGSTLCCSEIVTSFKDDLTISYYQKPNTGPGDSRNFGMRLAKGDYFIILDSDVLLPTHYLETVTKFLENRYVDCFGGADTAHDSFTPLQKAINYSMTSFLTTGGIRGNTKGVQEFEPRSFNMGISRKAFEATQGFAKIHPGEDPDISQRIIKAGFETAFIPGAAVFHKRRVSWRSFAVQVYKFGMVRPILNKWHPDASKITFWFPTLYIFFALGSLLLGIFYTWLFLCPLATYLVVVLIDAIYKTRSLFIGFMSIGAMFIQFFGYGYGFLKATIFVHWLEKRSPKAVSKIIF